MLPLQQQNRGPVPPCIRGVPVFSPPLRLDHPESTTGSATSTHPKIWKERAQIESKIWSNVLRCLNFRLHSIWINQNKGLCFGWPSSDVQSEAERRSPAGVKSQSTDESPGWNCQVKKKESFSHHLLNTTSSPRRQRLSSQLEPGGANGRSERSRGDFRLSSLLTGEALASLKVI